MPGYFLELDLTGKLVLVVGFGPVGRRKARGLTEAGSRVVVVDPAPPEDVPAGIDLRAEPYRPDHLDGVALAFAAGPPEVNRRVVADARARGIWVNAASDPESGDVRIPATWRDGPVAVAVSTGGGSPTLAGVLRDRAAGAIGPEAAGLIALLAELRPRVIASIADPGERAELLASAATARWLAVYRDRGREATRRELLGWFGLPPDDA